MHRFATVLVLSCLAAVGLAPAALASTPPSGTYAGNTHQHRHIKLKVRGEQLTLVNFSIQLQCRDGSVLIDQESDFQPTKLRNGKFRESQFGATDMVRFGGHVNGSRASGWLKVIDRVGKVRCVSPSVKFSIHRN